MAKTYLTPDELVIGNKWLKTVFFPCINKGQSDYIHRWDNDEVTRACNAIYNFIVDRTWDTNDTLIFHLKTLSSCKYFNFPGNAADEYKLSTIDICKIFANICAKKEIFWSDAEHTSFELDYFKKTTFGGVLWDFRCFVSQEPDTLKVPNTKVSSTTSTTPKTPRATGTSAGHTLYRNNAGGIIGTSKEILNGTYVYCIVGEFVNPGKTKPRIHVSPQNQAAPLKVKFNSGQGHNDCILYFESKVEAEAFKTICDQNLPSSVANLSVKKMTTDPNGYVKVDTNYGQAYIKASKLHEEINEEVEVTDSIDQLPESYYREEYEKAAFALNELLY